MTAALRETFTRNAEALGEGIGDVLAGRETREARAAQSILGEIAMRGLFLLKHHTEKK